LQKSVSVRISSISGRDRWTKININKDTNCDKKAKLAASLIFLACSTAHGGCPAVLLFVLDILSKMITKKKEKVIKKEVVEEDEAIQVKSEPVNEN
jgi:hypothetical protein